MNGRVGPDSETRRVDPRAASDTSKDGPSQPPSIPLVRDTMSELSEVIHVDHDFHEACVRMRRLQVPCLPVTDGDEIVGILSARTIYGAPRTAADGNRHARVGDHLPPGVAFCYLDDDLATALAVMDRSGHHCIVVVDDERHLVGLVTCDMITAALRKGGHPHLSGPDGSLEQRMVPKAGRAIADKPGRQRTYADRPKLRK